MEVVNFQSFGGLTEGLRLLLKIAFKLCVVIDITFDFTQLTFGQNRERHGDQGQFCKTHRYQCCVRYHQVCSKSLKNASIVFDA